MRAAGELVDAAFGRADDVAARVAGVPDLVEHEAHRAAEPGQAQRGGPRRHRQERDPVEARPAGPAVDVPVPPRVCCAPMLSARTARRRVRTSRPDRPAGASNDGRAPPPRRAISWRQLSVLVRSPIGSREPDQRAPAVRDAAQALARIPVLRVQPGVARGEAVARAPAGSPGAACRTWRPRSRRLPTTTAPARCASRAGDAPRWPPPRRAPHSGQPAAAPAGPWRRPRPAMRSRRGWAAAIGVAEVSASSESSPSQVREQELCRPSARLRRGRRRCQTGGFMCHLRTDELRALHGRGHRRGPPGRRRGRGTGRRRRRPR